MAPLYRKARFDRSRRYRWSLSREWSDEPARRVVFVMLNPSRADHRRDDPTIRRCMGFARDWGFDALDVVNLFGFRTHDPGELRAAADPVGARNDAFVRRTVRAADRVVLAWGNHGRLLGRDEALLASLSGELWCFGQTKLGCPVHPLYQRRDAPLQRFVRG